MSLCLVSGSLLAALPLTAFTLAWTHSIEKTRWEEDWQIQECNSYWLRRASAVAAPAWKSVRGAIA